jgi:CheY-like chemotaxis protein
MMNTVKTILIVEDEPMTRRMLQYILEKRYNVLVRNNVKEALWCLKTNSNINCILSDLYMPEIDGKEFIRQIRQQPQFARIPIVILSGAQESNLRINCLEIGADDFITKPFNPKEVQVRIEAILRRSYPDADPLESNLVTITPTPVPTQYMPWWKRMLDLISSGTTLLAVASLLLLVSILIKLNSKDPIIYKSKRAGAKYRIFDLYKFRIMRTDADQFLKKWKI